MLTKEAVIEYACEFLNLDGFTIDESDQSSDLVAKKDNQTLKVVATGAVSDLGGTNKKGRGFNKQQVRINLSLALFEISKQMTADLEKQEKYAIAIPDTIIYKKLVKEISQGVRVLNAKILLVSDVGLVKELS